MFWNKKSKPQKNSARGQAPVSGGTSGGQRSSESEKLRAQALANARAAREAIGEDTLNRIAAAMTKKQQSTVEKAKRQIASHEAERVADEILSMIDDH